MTIPVLALIVIALCSTPCWLAWRQTTENHVVIKKLLWTVEDFKTLLIEREHEAGYVSGASAERKLGAERAADLAAVAVTVAAEAVLAASASDVYDPDDNLVAHIKPAKKGGEGVHPRGA